MGCLVQVFEHSGNALEDSWVEIREIAIISEVMFIIPSDLFREPRVNFFKWVLPAGKIITGGQDPYGWKANSCFNGKTYRVCS